MCSSSGGCRRCPANVVLVCLGFFWLGLRFKVQRLCWGGVVQGLAGLRYYCLMCIKMLFWFSCSLELGHGLSMINNTVWNIRSTISAVSFIDLQYSKPPSRRLSHSSLHISCVRTSLNCNVFYPKNGGAYWRTQSRPLSGVYRFTFSFPGLAKPGCPDAESPKPWTVNCKFRNPEA